MNTSRRYRASLVGIAILSIVALTGFGCKPRNQAGGVFDASNVELIVWGLWQTSEQMSPILASFEQTTGAKVAYKKISSVAEYERELLQALAEGRGPDIFVIHHTWPLNRTAILQPAPVNVVDERAVREEFVDTVAEDVIILGQVYALPVSVDTLALYYNKDILASTGVARPPQTWQELQQIVERITQVSRLGTIDQSAAALGTAQNISRAADIMQLLFMQSGLDIADPADYQVSLSTDAGERALTFYTDFANKSKKVYTWDLLQDYSIDSFAEGESAMMVNYSYLIPTITAKNPRLRFAIAPVPQIADSQTVNFAAYWPFAVSKQSPNPAAAWRFIRHLTNTESAAQLNQSQQTPPARRDGVEALKRDPILGVFADQALTARSWPRGDVVAIDAIVSTMIDSVITGAATIDASLRVAEAQLDRIKPPVPVPADQAGDSGFDTEGGGIGVF